MDSLLVKYVCIFKILHKKDTNAILKITRERRLQRYVMQSKTHSHVITNKFLIRSLPEASEEVHYSGLAVPLADG